MNDIFEAIGEFYRKAYQSFVIRSEFGVFHHSLKRFWQTRRKYVLVILFVLKVLYH